MKKTAFWMSLLFVACMFSQGCCCNRPYVFPRLHWWRNGCCGASCGTSCYLGCPSADCGCGYGPVTNEHYFGAPMQINPNPAPIMPGSNPLTRATFPQR